MNLLLFGLIYMCNCKFTKTYDYSLHVEQCWLVRIRIYGSVHQIYIQ